MGESFPLFFEDLSPCMYVASSLAEGEKLKAVGWLAWGHPYKRRNPVGEDSLHAGGRREGADGRHGGGARPGGRRRRGRAGGGAGRADGEGSGGEDDPPS